VPRARRVAAVGLDVHILNRIRFSNRDRLSARLRDLYSPVSGCERQFAPPPHSAGGGGGRRSVKLRLPLVTTGSLAVSLHKLAQAARAGLQGRVKPNGQPE